MDDMLPPPPGSEHQPPPPVTPPPPPPRPTPAPPVIAAHPNRPPKSGSGWRLLAVFLMIVLALVLFGKHVTHKIAARASNLDTSPKLAEYVLQQTNGDNKIAVVEVSGVISGSQVDGTGMGLVEYLKEQFNAAQNDSDVRAVLLKVDSPGGEVLASDQIYNVIRQFQDNSGKPVVVSMGALAASGGYYISSPCRWIVANELTLTGSIGVIMEGYNYRGLMDKVGVEPQVFKSGRFKDMLSGEREPDLDKLSPEDRKNRIEENQMVQTLINDTYNKFKDVVRQGRTWAASKNGPTGSKLADDWEDYADGRVLEGKRALELGLVDEIGDFDTAVKRAEIIAGINSATLVEYRLPFDFGSVLSRLMGKAQPPTLKVDLGFDLPRLRAGLPYFILPVAVPH